MGLLTSAAQPHLFPETFVPPLENGDRLTRAEFERRYAAMPEHVRAELVEGVVIMASPVRHTMHGAPHADLISWATIYRAGTPGVLGGRRDGPARSRQRTAARCLSPDRSCSRRKGQD
jgi:hypothetical protein